MNPVAPSAVVLDGSQGLDSGGVSRPQGKGGVPGPPEDKGKNGNGNGNGNTPTNSTPGSPAAPGLKKVEIEGLISAKSGNSITVNAQQVTVPATATIRHGQTPVPFAQLAVGDRVHVRAERAATTTTVVTTTLTATEVIVQNPGDGEGSGEDTPTTLVSVTATDAVASESNAADTGTFTLTRSGSSASLTTALSVSYTVSGTATSGVDYTALTGTATFLAGQSTATVSVVGLADSLTEGDESVTLTLTPAASYDLGAPASATVTITDANLPLVSVVAFDPDADEFGGQGVFRFTRSIVSATDLTVNYTIAGDAVNGSDYQLLSGTVTIPAGAASVDVTVAPIMDSDFFEGEETVIVTVADLPAYNLGAQVSATVTITQ